MFSANILQPQTWGALSQVTTLVNNLRTTAHSVLQRSNLSPNYRPSTHDRKRQPVFKFNEDQPISEAFSEILHNLPADFSTKDFLLNTSRCEPLNNWTSSPYTSADTFFENKTGFHQNELLSSDGMRLAHHVLSGWKCDDVKRIIQSLVRNQQVRGFKTYRSTNPSSIGKTSPQSPSQSVLNDLRQTVHDRLFPERRASKAHSTKLKAMLQDTNTAPDMQEKIKKAFAEGYVAHDKQEADPKATVTSRLMKFVFYVALIWLSIQVIQMLGGVGGGGMGGLGVLGREKYEINPESINVNFSDVKGVEEAKQELQDIVGFLRDPEKFTSLGAKLPRGVLLVGPPGIGKTLLARAVAGEAGVPFFQASGSEFDELFVGTGAKRVRQLFHAAKQRTPCVIFIDEIDTVGAKRTNSQIHPYANQTINQLLSEMDGFHPNEGVIVMGATNRKDNLDKALLRPGRFDVEVVVYPPDHKGRMEIIEYYLEKIVVDPSVDVAKIAHGTTGFTGADIENMVNQAALKAAMDYSPLVTKEHLDFARDKVLMGPAKKTKIPDEATNWVTANHEAGHTVVAYYTKYSTPLHKVTIIPRGMSLGHTSFISDHEVYNQTKAELLAQMDVAMGGRVAEEIVYGSDKVTTGAGNDFQTATAIAGAMVKKFGMSEKLGVRVFSDSDAVDNGLSLVRVNEISPAVQELVDFEIKRLLQESYERARNIVKSHLSEHRALAKALMDHETLDFKQVSVILDGGRVT